MSEEDVNNPFIEWHGGNPPVWPEQTVEYKTKLCGDEILCNKASILNWNHYGFEGAEYITHYRVLLP